MKIQLCFVTCAVLISSLGCAAADSPSTRLDAATSEMAKEANRQQPAGSQRRLIKTVELELTVADSEKPLDKYKP
jgi:hypothetical protein